MVACVHTAEGPREERAARGIPGKLSLSSPSRLTLQIKLYKNYNLSLATHMFMGCDPTRAEPENMTMQVHFSCSIPLGLDQLIIDSLLYFYLRDYYQCLHTHLSLIHI